MIPDMNGTIRIAASPPPLSPAIEVEVTLFELAILLLIGGLGIRTLVGYLAARLGL